MSLAIQLNKCKTIESLDSFCRLLENKNIEFNGRQFVNILTNDSLNLYQVTNKIIDLYEKESKNEAAKILTSEQVTSLIYQLKKISSSHCKSRELLDQSFGEESKLFQIASECKKTVRNSNEAMETVRKNYNRLAESVNKKIQNKVSYQEIGADGRTDVMSDLARLEFLNIFLGVKWDRSQRHGNAPIPLCGSGDVAVFPAPLSLRPRDCESLGALYSLINSLKENPVVIREGKTIEVFGQGPIHIEDIHNRLVELYELEMKKDPYIKTDLYLQFIAAVFILKKLCPGASKSIPQNVMKIYEQCIKGIQEDRKLWNQFRIQYTQLAIRLNDYIKEGMLFNRASQFSQKGSRVEDIKERLEKLEFLNEFIGLKLIPEHFQTRAIIPVLFDENNPAHIEVALYEYNDYALLLNYELHIQSVYERYNQLQRLLDPNSLLTLVISDEGKKALKNELSQVEAELEVIGEPLDKAILKSMIEEQNRLANLIRIQLTPDQRLGLAPYPVLGRDIALPSAKNFPPSVTLPQRIALYNLLAGTINSQRHYHDRKLEAEKFRSEFRHQSIDEFLKNFDLVNSNFEKLEQEEKELQEMKRNYLVGDDRFALTKLSGILLLERFGEIKFTESQKRGEEDLPIIDVNSLPFPDIKTLEDEFAKVDSSKGSEIVSQWPKHWQTALKGARNIPQGGG